MGRYASTYLQPLRRHVAPCADEGVGHGVDKLSGNAKVADFDVSRAVHQDVGRLHVAVDDGVLLAQVAQASKHLGFLKLVHKPLIAVCKIGHISANSRRM